MPNLSLLTDLYQLTMLAGYYESGKAEQNSCFDLYFRRNPFQGSYGIAAGLEPALDFLEQLGFEEPELHYLRSLSLFSEEFLEWLKELRFEGTVWAAPEGSLVFPNEPLLRVEAPLAQAQLVESALLNIVNFQTLVATKASRVKTAADQGTVLEFGLRRAQGVDGAMAASRAAYIGGCDATSNTLAGRRFGIPVKGTHAHSWIMSFPSELEAFRAYARCYPTSCTLLVDTYDTLESGIPNAITVGLELAEQGFQLAGVRLDSGDLAKLSQEARRMLDRAGLPQAKIVASNDLDEHEITRLKKQGAQIDIWGVGTNLVTCKDEPALGGVYKLAAFGTDWEPRIKVSANPIKTTIPGRKQVYRFFRQDGSMAGDLLALAQEKLSNQESVPSLCPYTHHREELRGTRVQALLEKVMEKGLRTEAPGSPEVARQRARQELQRLPDSIRAISEPLPYRVGLSEELYALRQSMLAPHKL